jgi:hypothetical protein
MAVRLPERAQLTCGAMRRAVAMLVAAGLLSGCSLGDEETRPPQLGGQANDEEAAEGVGSPSSATRNTVRVGGGDSGADAAGVAEALFPATGSSDRPTVVVLVDVDDWQSGIAASVLAGPPIGAPLLISDGDELPAVTQEALERLAPRGSDLSKDAQVIRVGQDVARPEGFKTAVIEGDNPYQRAAATDRFFSAARGRPSGDVVLYSGERPEWAMPAASWAARSGDAVLPIRATSVPAPVARALKTHERPNVYLLGTERVIGTEVARLLRRRKLARSVDRIAGPTPVENAISFARYKKGDFGWGIVVPGYNFAVASTTRPADAPAAAPLGTRGVFAPLLLTDRAEALPEPLEAYLLSVQPGYEDDPGQAVYNRAWILGDDSAISSRQQAQIDQITELIPVQANAP